MRTSVEEVLAPASVVVVEGGALQAEPQRTEPGLALLLGARVGVEEGGEGDISYVEMVRVATDWLSRRVALPPFEIWLEDYKAHPDLYEEYFMGLGEAEAEASGCEPGEGAS